MTRSHPSPSRYWLTNALLAVAITGCGGGSGGEPGLTGPSSTTAAAPTTATAAGADAASVTVNAGGTVTEAQEAAQAEVRANAVADATAAAVAAEAAVETTSLAQAGNTSLAPTNTIQAAPSVQRIEGTPAVQTAALAQSGVPTLTVRARASLLRGVGALMTVRVDGVTLGTVEVRSTAYSDYAFAADGLRAGAKVDVVFSNDESSAAEDRNLFVAYLTDGQQVLLPTAAGAILDKGKGSAAFDGLNTTAGQGDIYWSAALRLTWPASTAVDVTARARKQDAVRFLMQASFGPSATDLESLSRQSYAAWIDAQMARPLTPDFVNAVQARYDKGDAWRPNGANYTPTVVGQTFWRTAATAPDQLRRRVAFALHQVFVVSQLDSNLWHHSRAYANYLDLLNKHAFGNFRALIEDIALSPAMGIYLSHMRNRKEDASTGRLPDENFARELMQLFTIGLYELNTDGSLRRDANGQPIETYGNADVMALAKVFTGWSWAFADNELTESKFRSGNPNYAQVADQKIDLLPMKAYPGQHSTAEKQLFSGKAWAVTIPAGGTAQADLKIALDTLFNHPNVGPFIGRQLIQRLVSSNPSPAYVARVAAVFADNGRGVRGDLGAVVRAILLDTEARTSTASVATKLREPVLRVAHWMRALAATSTTGEYMMAWELDTAGQRALYSPSVFNHFRPGYVPPNSSLARVGATAPELQIVNESTVASWINTAEVMAGTGLGHTGSTADVAVNHAALGTLAASGSLVPLLDHLNLVLLGGRMSATLRQSILDAVGGATHGDATTLAAYRARAAVFLTLVSPEFVTQP